MSKPAAKLSGPTETSPLIVPPPAIRMVRAFKDAVEASQQASDPSEEAYIIEGLLIAADASFAALTRFANLRHESTYGANPPAEVGEDHAVAEGYKEWLHAADRLHKRMGRLYETGYESERMERFERQFDKAEALVAEARDREEIERRALRTDRLAELAARLKPLQASYDDEDMLP